jgi:protein-S-isoprenylcysteine O-methyltransferase Ste14
MPNSDATSAKITPLFVVQVCALLLVLTAVALRPGGWNGARIVGLSIAALAALLLITARWQLGRSFSLTPQARELVTRGLYSKIRNPIYVFGVLFLVGALIALQYRYAFLFLLVLIPMQIMRARKESKVLEARFGEEYRKYRQGTWF